jgi:hypothetical protein
MLLWSLAEPAHVVITEGESRGCTEESHEPSRLYQDSFSLKQLHLTLDTCKHRESSSENCHSYPLSSHSCPLTHSVSLVLHKSPFKIAKRTSQLNPNSLWEVCIQCWSWKVSAWNPRLGSSPRAAESELDWFSWAEGGHISMSPCYIAISVESLKSSITQNKCESPRWLLWQWLLQIKLLSQ